MTRVLCLTLVLLQFVLPVLAHEHGSGTHLHADRLWADQHDEGDEPDHDRDAVYLPVAVSLVGLRDAGPDVPVDVAFAFVAICPPDDGIPTPPPPIYDYRPPPECPLFLSLCSIRR